MTGRLRPVAQAARSLGMGGFEDAGSTWVAGPGLYFDIEVKARTCKRTPAYRFGARCGPLVPCASNRGNLSSEPEFSPALVPAWMGKIPAPYRVRGRLFAGMMDGALHGMERCVTPAKAGVQVRPTRPGPRLDSGLRRNDGRGGVRGSTCNVSGRSPS